MNVANWKNIKPHWNYGQEKETQSLIISTASIEDQPNPGIFPYLYKLKKKFLISPKRLEIFVKCCNEKWGQDFGDFLNQLKPNQNILDQLTCIALTRDTNMEEHGDLPHLAATLLEIDIGILCTFGDEDLKDMEDNTLMFVFDKSYQVEFDTVIKYLSKTLRETFTPLDTHKKASPTAGCDCCGVAELSDHDEEHEVMPRIRRRSHNTTPPAAFSLMDLAGQYFGSAASTSSESYAETHPERKIALFNYGIVHRPILSYTHLFPAADCEYIPIKLLNVGEFTATFTLKHRSRDLFKNATIAGFAEITPQLVTPVMNACALIKEISSCQHIIHFYKFQAFREQTTNLLTRYTSMITESDLQEEEKRKITKFEQHLHLSKEYLVLYHQSCGETLHDWLTKEDPSYLDREFEFRKCITSDLISGIEYLDRHGLTHGDLNLRDIYFTEGFQLPVKIGNYIANTAKCSGRMSQTEETWLAWGRGTKWCSSTRKGREKFSIDWFSLAIILSQLCNGRAVWITDKMNYCSALTEMLGRGALKQFPGLHYIVMNLTVPYEKERRRLVQCLKVLSKNDDRKQIFVTDMYQVMSTLRQRLCCEEDVSDDSG